MKHTRRDFLAASSLAAAGVQTPWSARALTLSQPYEPVVQPLIVIFDEHLADSRAFALRARVTGARSVPLSRDIGELWFQLQKRNPDSPQQGFAGLTQHADAFLLARFAQDVGMQVTQHAVGPLIMWRLDPPAA
ncbi:hypothetical protein [Caballeronia sp. DA-9]|uniref:hypothetical protein n=1 Tax=Caballeronia sp. DA-9 TaxID=3436237 RepID=UPI003F672608